MPVDQSNGEVALGGLLAAAVHQATSAELFALAAVGVGGAAAIEALCGRVAWFGAAAALAGVGALAVVVRPLLGTLRS
jgi:hypothetical protein